jgi:predicted methyltransferase
MRNKLTIAAMTAGLLLGAALPVASQSGADPIAAAVASEARPDRDRARDAGRKPAETLAFAGVRPGMSVIEIMPGGGYFTRLLSRSVGPQGRIHAFQPQEIATRFPNSRTTVEALPSEPGLGNVQTSVAPIDAVAAPAPVDLVFTALNYHDLHADIMGPADVAAVNRAVFAALKPGGAFVVIDHHAPAGVGASRASDLHRIDIETVKAEVLAAGFVLEAESDILRRPDDPRTAGVYDPVIRGSTDQFLLRFRKPA